MIEKTILVTLSDWAVRNLGINESLSEVGTEILKKCVWTPLKEKVVKFFSSDKEAQDFVERISTQNCVNEHKPERDIEDVYEEMKSQLPDKELFESITNFFEENQKLIEEANRMNVAKEADLLSIGKVDNYFCVDTISTINIYPKNN